MKIARILFPAICLLLAIGFVFDRVNYWTARTSPPGLAVAHAAAPPTAFCGRVWPQLDSASTPDPRATAEENAAREAARLQFYSLCVTDSRLGTSEAPRFLEEERTRAHRILAAGTKNLAEQR